MRLLTWAGTVLPMRMVSHDLVRLVISVGGLGFAVVLVLVLRGIMDGTVARSTSYIDNVGADVFVAREGVFHMALANSSLPADSALALSQAPGVRSVSGIVRVNAIVVAESGEQPIQLIGYDPASPLGGPWSLASGRGVQSDNEIVGDSVMADQLNVHVGDTLRIAGVEFTVVGLSGETAAIAGKMVFISLNAARQLLQMPGRVSFFLIDVDGATPESVRDALSRDSTGVEIMTRAELSANDRDLLGGLFVTPVNVTSVVGLIVGLAVVGLTMYTITAERMRDFGVLRAIGAPNRFLLQTVSLLALVICVTGFAAGVLGCIALRPAIERFAPDIGVFYDPAYALKVFAAVLAMGFIGAGAPMARILRVDPLMVFHK